MADILLGHAAGTQGAGHDLAPDGQVIAGIAHNSLLAGGAGGGVDAHHILHGAGKKAIGIVVPQVLLVCKGQLDDIVDGLDVLGTQAHLIKALTVEGHILINAPDSGAQTLALQFAELLAGHGFCLAVVHVKHSDHTFLCVRLYCIALHSVKQL